MTRSVLTLGAWLILAALPACTSTVVKGLVTDDRGEALPGVVVQVGGGERQVQTDARGRFRIRYPSEAFQLEFSKSGYASARLIMDVEEGRRGPTVTQLWKLPPNAGVYLYEDFHYTSTGWVLPKPFFMADGAVAYGTRRGPTPATRAGKPVIICYRTPRYDARLSRLVLADAAQPGSKIRAFPVWTAAGTVAADLIPIDEPQGTLLQLELNQPLEPGAYAVHWGALDGYTTLENRMFMFEVIEPEPAPPGIHDSSVDGDSPRVASAP